jgi:hypothetical protein
MSNRYAYISSFHEMVFSTISSVSNRYHCISSFHKMVLNNLECPAGIIVSPTSTKWFSQQSRVSNKYHCIFSFHKMVFSTLPEQTLTTLAGTVLYTVFLYTGLHTVWNIMGLSMESNMQQLYLIICTFRLQTW